MMPGVSRVATLLVMYSWINDSAFSDAPRIASTLQVRDKAVGAPEASSVQAYTKHVGCRQFHYTMKMAEIGKTPTYICSGCQRGKYVPTCTPVRQTR